MDIAIYCNFDAGDYDTGEKEALNPSYTESNLQLFPFIILFVSFPELFFNQICIFSY